MVTGTKQNKSKAGDKPKARRLAISQLVITGAWERTFSSGKTGFFGQAQDPTTGERYQIIGAVKLGS